MDTSSNATPTQAQQPLETPTAKDPTTNTESGFSKFAIKWIIHRLFAVLAWAWVILRLADADLPFNVPISRDYLPVPFLLAWAGFVVAHKWARAVFYFPYLLFFPFLILLSAAYWIFQFLRKTLKLPVHAFRVVRSGATFFLTVIAITISWLVTILANNASTRATASLIALIGTYVVVMQSFRWASNPYRPLLAIIEFLSEKGRKIFEEAYIKPGVTDSGDKRDQAIKACDWGLKGLDRLYQAKAPLKQGLTAFTHSNVLPFFIVGFIAVYGILASSFSIALFNIEKAWGPIIEGLGNPPTLFSYFYFSFLSQATAVPDGVVALSFYGQVWILWLVMTGILLLTILIALFTTSVGIHGQSAISEVRGFSETARRDLTIWRGQLSMPVIETEVIDVEAKITADAADTVSSVEDRA